jgi:ATP-binding cassette subfamily C (CFTR/MRP) protein 1
LIPTLAAVLSFIVYSLTGHQLHVATIFASLQLFNVIQTPMSELPTLITALADAHVATVRLCKILTAEEQPHGLIIDREQEYGLQVSGDFAYETAAPPDQNARNRVSHKKAKGFRRMAGVLEPEKETAFKASGDKKNEDIPFSLKDIDLRIPRGALVCIFGRIGSGKSALLEGILGEMRQTRGHVLFGGNVSLVTQTPWIQSASIRDNITFGKDVDEERLAEAVRSCALTRDLDELVDGVFTEIGG